MRRIQVEAAVITAEAGGGRMLGGIAVDGRGDLDFKFVDYPEAIGSAAEILVRIKGLA